MRRFRLKIPIIIGLLAGYILLGLVYHIMNAEEARNVLTQQPSVHKTKPTATLCFLYNGRLGNFLFQYAALIGISREKNMIPVIQQEQGFVQFFHLNAVQDLKGKCSSSTGHWCRRPCAYDFESVDFDRNLDTHLMGSFQSWRYFIGVEKELREQFRFKQPVLQRARRVLFSALVAQTTNMTPEHSLVGIHVRRGDMMSDISVKGGYRVAPKEYFLRAMDFFKNKIPNIRFVVCTLDLEWAMQALPHKDVIFIQAQQPDVDLAILSFCDHMIMSVGSFGWWAGWLAAGITVYYKHQYREGSELAKHFDMDDYMYPGWIGLK